MLIITFGFETYIKPTCTVYTIILPQHRLTSFKTFL